MIVVIVLAELVKIFHVIFSLIGPALLIALLVDVWGPRRRVVLWTNAYTVWATAIFFSKNFWGHCLLTSLENFFRQQGGQLGYQENFLVHHVQAILNQHWSANAATSFELITNLLIFLALLGINIVRAVYIISDRRKQKEWQKIFYQKVLGVDRP